MKRLVIDLDDDEIDCLLHSLADASNRHFPLKTSFHEGTRSNHDFESDEIERLYEKFCRELKK